MFYITFALLKLAGLLGRKFSSFINVAISRKLEKDAI